MTYVALLVLVTGLFLLGAVYLSGHKTPVPAIRRPEILWVPGITLVLFSGMLFLAPYWLDYSRCEVACDALEGPPAGTGWAARWNTSVSGEYATCVTNGVAEVRRTAEELARTDPSVNVAVEVALAEPAAREVCSKMAVGRCVARCFRRDQDTEG